MYDDHYGLTGRPFQLTPDSRFWFDLATHKKAMAYLGYGLSQGEGFIVITGEPGTGKTTLLGHLMDTIDGERLNVVKIVSTQLEAEDLLRTVAAGLDVDATGLPKATLLAAIERGLHTIARGGRRTLIVIDEAQALPIESLEELRMLSNFQAGGYALVQIFLLGQPEFRDALVDRRLEQLRQRVIAMHHLEPMAPHEVESYLIHRLSLVGWRGKPRFTNDAIAAMHRWSGGNARKLNVLAGRVLLFGAIEGIETFSGDDVETVIADLDQDAPALRDRRRPTLVETPQPHAEGPLPITPMPPVLPPMPPVSAPMPSLTPEPAPEPVAEAPRVPETPRVAEAGPADADLARRMARLEARLEEQDAALRRVLTLMVDWVENDSRKPELATGFPRV